MINGWKSICKKILPHTLLIGFLNTSLGNNDQKTSPQSYKAFCFFILIIYIFFCGINQKNLLQNEIKDLLFEVSNFSSTFCFFNYLRDQIFMTSTQKGGEEVWKFVTCLWILFIVYFREWGWVKKISHFFRRHNFMTLNVKKVTFLALMPVFTS